MPVCLIQVSRHMNGRRLMYHIAIAAVLSIGFVLTAIYTFAWATDVPKVGVTALIRAFYMPQALAAALTLDAFGPREKSEALAYAIAFLATLPVSFLYAVLGGIAVTWFKHWAFGAKGVAK